LHNELVKQPSVIELAYQPAATYQPDVLVHSGSAHLIVNGPNITPDEPNVGTWNRRQISA
jgi:hypothetical protein